MTVHQECGVGLLQACGCAALPTLAAARSATPTPKLQVRSRDEVGRFFEGLDLLEPGIEVGHRWRPDPREAGAPEPTDVEVSLWTGVGIKP